MLIHLDTFSTPEQISRSILYFFDLSRKEESYSNWLKSGHIPVMNYKGIYTDLLPLRHILCIVDNERYKKISRDLVNEMSQNIKLGRWKEIFKKLYEIQFGKEEIELITEKFESNLEKNSIDIYLEEKRAKGEEMTFIKAEYEEWIESKLRDGESDREVEFDEL